MGSLLSALPLALAAGLFSAPAVLRPRPAVVLLAPAPRVQPAPVAPVGRGPAPAVGGVRVHTVWCPCCAGRGRTVRAACAECRGVGKVVKVIAPVRVERVTRQAWRWTVRRQWNRQWSQWRALPKAERVAAFSRRRGVDAKTDELVCRPRRRRRDDARVWAQIGNALGHGTREEQVLRAL